MAGRFGYRAAREQRTVETMIGMYCRGVHGTKSGMCPACSDLVEYARLRVQRCPLIADKPACNKCPVHCYSPEMRQRIRDVMRYAGPRMTLRHPVMAWFHLLDTLRRSRDQ